MSIHLSNFCRYQDNEGWVPATYLQEYRGPNTIATPSAATQIIGNVMNISELDSRKSRPLPITPAGVSGTSDDRRSRLQHKIIWQKSWDIITLIC